MFKSVCVLAISTFSVLSATAQTQKGSLMLGGSVLDAYAGGAGPLSGPTFGLTANVKAGYFVSNRLAIGLGGQAGLAVNEPARYSTYALQPFIRYYIGSDSVLRNGAMVQRKLRFFTEADMGYRYTRSRYDYATGSVLMGNHGLTFGAGGGMAYFIAPNVSLETSLKLRGYHGLETNRFGTVYRPELSVGINISLPRRSKK